MRRAKQIRPFLPSSGRALLLMCSGLGCVPACKETPYIIFRSDGVQTTGGSACSAADCASGGSAASSGGSGGSSQAGTGAVTGAAAGEGGASGGDTTLSGGMGGAGDPEGPGENCESPQDPGVTLERLQLAESGLCVAQGPYAPLVIEPTTWPSYSLSLVECASDMNQQWVITTFADGSLAFRSETAALNAADGVDERDWMNLDLQFSATTGGTPIILFEANNFANQRFTPKPGQSGMFKLAPSTALGQCMTALDVAPDSGAVPRLVLQLCDLAASDQKFRRLGCR